MIFCKRNHRQTDANVIVVARAGKTYKTCRLCHALRQKLKYRNDAAYREAEKSRSLQRYYSARSYPL